VNAPRRRNPLLQPHKPPKWRTAMARVAYAFNDCRVSAAMTSTGATLWKWKRGKGRLARVTRIRLSPEAGAAMVLAIEELVRRVNAKLGGEA